MKAEMLLAAQGGSGSFMRSIDARAKLMFGLACLVMTAGSSGPSVPLFVGVLSALLLASGGIGIKGVVVRAAEPVFFAFIIALFQTFLVPGEAIFRMDLFGAGLTATQEGLTKGLYIVARVYGGVMVVLFVSMTTPVERLLAAAAWLKAPQGLVEITMFAYRYVFALLEDALTVYAAQRGRLGYSTPARAARSLGTIAGAVMLRAYSQAEATGEAMAQRGYNGGYVPAFGENGGTAGTALMGGLALLALTVFIWT